MKQQLSPVVVAVIVLVVVGAIAAFFYKGANPSHDETPPQKPDSVAKEWEKYTGNKKPGAMSKPGGN